MFDFYASDLGTQAIKESKYYWQNEANNCCVVVPDSVNSNTDMQVPLYFVQVPSGSSVVCEDISLPNDDIGVKSIGTVSITIRTIDRSEGKCVRPEGCGRILDSILTLIDNKSWSFPRAKSDTPYIRKSLAELYEDNFRTMITAPDNGNCLYASIAVAGTMLLDRLGIQSDIIFDVQHYDTETNTQVDNMIQVTEDKYTDVVGRTVIVVDDLISSGRTAKAVIRRLSELGAAKIYYFALYRTICSREVVLPKSDNIIIQASLPWSNAYWTYGRGFDLSDEESRSLPDIYAATKHWDWETDEDVKELIDFFTSEQ